MSRLATTRIINASARRASPAGVPTRGRPAMLLLNAFPLLHALLLLGLLIIPYDSGWRRVLYAVAALYLLPPLLATLIRRLFVPREGVLAPGSRDFLAWWALFNLQVLFCRLPWLEEIPRLVPGLYSLWLRLWGAKIGRLTYWAPGMVILDRSFVHVGDDVIFGAGVRLNPHVMSVNEGGEKEVTLATVKIGDGAVIGGYSLLTAGTEIAAGECVRAFLVSPPFSRWENGRRDRDSAPDPGRR